MMRRPMCVGFLVSAFGILLAGHASAGFTAASASGPGGTVTNLAITTTFTTDDSIQFDANYTSQGPIDFFLTLNGTGNYFVGARREHHKLHQQYLLVVLCLSGHCTGRLDV